jgi:hypothetical protein
MRTTQIRTICSLIVLGSLLVVANIASAQQRSSKQQRGGFWPATTAKQTEAEARIYAELQKPTRFEFSEMPLADVVVYLKDLHGIDIEINRRALEDAGINPNETLITRRLSGVTLKSALKLVLEQLGLNYVIKHDVLMITSKADADAHVSPRVYAVGDLVRPRPIRPVPAWGWGW